MLMPHDEPWLTRLAQRWYARNTFAGYDLPHTADLVERKHARRESISVVLPALNEESTIGDICRVIRSKLMEERALVDELVVIDGGSTDDTADIARAAGATVATLDRMPPRIPVVRGKGESLWRSLWTAQGDIVVWIDADIRNFDEHFVTRLVAPMLLDDDVALVKAFYRRPISHGEEMLASGGGRVTELLARPLLSSFFPELSAVRQPLSGEYAGRREVLRRLPFFTGYSVEVGLLIDLLSSVGLDAIVQVDLEERVHRNRPLEELGPMATAIARTIMRRAEEWGRISSAFDFSAYPLLLPTIEGVEARAIEELERPPVTTGTDLSRTAELSLS